LPCRFPRTTADSNAPLSGSFESADLPEFSRSIKKTILPNSSSPPGFCFYFSAIQALHSIINSIESFPFLLGNSVAMSTVWVIWMLNSSKGEKVMDKQNMQRMGLIALAIGLLSLNLNAEPGHKWKKQEPGESYRWMSSDHNHHGNDGREERWRDDRREREHGYSYRSYGSPFRTQFRNYFNTDDHRYLSDYYRRHDRHFWADRYPASLLPGLYKHLVRNGHLPPGLERQLVPFPSQIERHLCPLPRNYVRFMLGGKGLILDAQFNIIDIMDLY
jgi:hypothetical protein